ncbi:MAG: TraR/DksA C4-type zinc finger protein [Desulfuromonadales bacterium]|nr:TraR/DksA C4-type zinc finger protein [Desulfuromonadales bacterium]
MSDTLWDRCVAFHGHECPGLAIGIKVCEAARRHLGIVFSADEQVVCVTENDACCVDAIQFLAGCSVGKGNLIFRNRGKMAFTFFRRDTGERARFVLKNSISRGELDRPAFQRALLEMDPDDVFDKKEPTFSLPETARLFAGVICEQCGESTAEHMVRLKEGHKLCLDCFDEYSRGW